MQLEQILPHLSPPVKKLQEMHTKQCAAALAEAKKIGKVSLGGGGGKSLADFGSLDGDTAAAPAAEKEEEKEEEEMPFEALQPLGVLCAVVRLRHWPTVLRLMDELTASTSPATAPSAPRSAICSSGSQRWPTRRSRRRAC